MQTDDATSAVLRSVGLTDDRITAVTPLTGGTFNAVTRVTLTDGGDWVVKIPPPATDGTLMSYERDLLVNEVEFCTRAGAPDVVPRVLHSELDPTAPTGPFVIMSACPGRPWSALTNATAEHTERTTAGHTTSEHTTSEHTTAGHTTAGHTTVEHAEHTVTDAEERRLRNELGRIVARLHSVAGPGGFGYPAGALGPLSPTWRQAFTAMTDAVLADADTYRARLPRPTAAIRAVLADASPVLDDVTRPALVHFDLWQGNLLVAGEPGARTIGGIIDGERMFWGDPVADFVSLALFTDIQEDEDFLAGYGAGRGQPVVFDASARLRLALYRCYLYLIMLVETVPRRVPQDHLDWAWKEVGPQLESALDNVESALRARG
ncbi:MULTISPECIES: phosphotransferase family protein [unclassified Streptomyces]|uniref:phosphotransferase family protein n=1 Tax=unclassified Streptomyces TaxID=2593676 RepID=UPI0036E8332A